MTEEEWQRRFENDFKPLPTRDNLCKFFGFFTYYLGKFFNGTHDHLDKTNLSYRRIFIGKLANKILSWFSLYKKDIVSGIYFFDGIEDRLKTGILEKLKADEEFEKDDFDRFLKVFEQLNGPYAYMIEVNGSPNVADGVQNGSHIFQGIHVTGLPGGTVFEVMRELYQSHGGPLMVLESKEKVYLTNPDGGNINKLRMRVMKYIEILDDKSGNKFPIEVKVSGERLEVIPRGANPKARAKRGKEGGDSTKTSE